MSRTSSGNSSMGTPVQPGRLGLVFVLLLLLAGATAWRLISIQLIEHGRYSARAEQQYTLTRTLEPDRGMIVDRQGRQLVENLSGYGSVAVRPGLIEDVTMVTGRLADVLDLPLYQVRQACRRDEPFLYIDRQVEPEKLDRIEKMQLPGVDIERETRRGYPYGSVGGQVIGHVTVDGNGGAGVEQVCEAVLSGRDGWAMLQLDAHGRAHLDPSYPSEAPVDGGRVVLTLDIDAQAIAEEELARGIEENEAEGGMVVITRPLTGEILAIASSPGYDPNRYSDVSLALQKNRALTDVFEPGSTFKIVPFAGVLERGLAELDEVIDCENGSWRVADRILHDSHPYDTLTVREGFAKSSNILTAKLASRMSPGEFYTVMRDFGFGQETGIDFVGEVRGLLPHVSRWSGVSQANMAMGQGVAVTALQVAMAYGAIANNGWLLRPLLIRSTVGPDGEVQQYSPRKVRQVMSPRTARILRKLMVQAVKDGTGGRADLTGIQVAGKTGTAQKPDPNGGGYLRGQYVSSFAGFLPASSPEWLAVVVIDNPQGELYYGGSVAGPVFRRIMQRLLVTVPREQTRSVGESSSNVRALPDGHVLLPSLQSRTRSEAELELAALGLQPRWDGEGTVVVGQKYAEGSCLPLGETVTLTLGCAARPDEVAAPELRNLSIRSALRELTRCGLKSRVEGTGMIVAQHPAPGDRIAPGATVTLTARPAMEAAR